MFIFDLSGMSGLTSQPPMGAVCTALEQTNLGTGIRYADIQALNLYWSQVRMLYSCFEANVRASDSSVFDHEMPGGQYTNLMVSVFGCDMSNSLLSYAVLSFAKCTYMPLVPSFSAWSRYSVDRYEFSLLLLMVYLLTIWTIEIKQKYIEANDLVS